jgi:hypothetical protein
MSGHESVSTFCRAQVSIDHVREQGRRDRRDTQQRVKACRNLIIEELQRKNVTSMEVNIEGVAGPTFFRLKRQTCGTVPVEDVLAILRQTRATLDAHSVEHGYDLPRLVAASLRTAWRARLDAGQPRKPTLLITASRERGVESTPAAAVSSECEALAQNMFEGRRELTAMRQTEADALAPAREEQRRVEQSVRLALDAVDPERRSCKVQVAPPTQGGGTATPKQLYYLRCKEEQRRQRLGIKRVLPIVEEATAAVLERGGVPRDMLPTAQLPRNFWEDLMTLVEQRLRDAEQATLRTMTKISLDRVPKRQRMTAGAGAGAAAPTQQSSPATGT